MNQRLAVIEVRCVPVRGIFLWLFVIVSGIAIGGGLYYQLVVMLKFRFNL